MEISVKERFFRFFLFNKCIIIIKDFVLSNISEVLDDREKILAAMPEEVVYGHIKVYLHRLFGIDVYLATKTPSPEICLMLEMLAIIDHNCRGTLRVYGKNLEHDLRGLFHTIKGVLKNLETEENQFVELFNETKLLLDKNVSLAGIASQKNELVNIQDIVEYFCNMYEIVHDGERINAGVSADKQQFYFAKDRLFLTLTLLVRKDIKISGFITTLKDNILSVELYTTNMHVDTLYELIYLDNTNTLNSLSFVRFIMPNLTVIQLGVSPLDVAILFEVPVL